MTSWYQSPSQHNAIIGRSGIRKIRAVPSTAHEMLKFPVEGGTVTLQSSRVIPMECAMISGPSIQPPAVNQVLEEKINIAIHPEYPEQTVAIGSTLTEKGRKELCSLLKQNLDIFAWKPADMTGVPRNIAEHRLNIREGYSPVRQKKRGQAPERNKVIQEEVEKLVDAGIMKETLRILTTLPQRLLSITGNRLGGVPLWVFFQMLLGRIQGYHQIKMAKEDEEKTAFITSQGIFCYSKMPFGLKNAGSTYQRLVDKAFQKQIGRNLEVYVDDLVIKSRTEEEVIRDITETFKTLRQINMKLNPKKCTSMQESIYLGYKVSTNGLRACPEKADAVLSLPSPRCIKDVQKLNGKLASLNRFLSKSAEKSLPFFKTLKKCTKKSDFQWTPEAEEAFKQMKKLIAELPTLTAPRENEELIIYLAAAKEAISAVLMTDREGRQTPVYFVSRTLRGPEVNYTPMEKLVLALLSASKRLKRYFQAHTVVVITNQPMKQLLSSSEISGRMLKWKSSRRIRHPYRQGPQSKVLVEEIEGKIHNEKEILDICRKEGIQDDTICEYLTKEILPEDKKKARAVRRKAARNLIRECNDCQIHRPSQEIRSRTYPPSTSPWPFYKWGIDIAGPFPEGPGKVKFLIVAIDYFTKWIEAKVVATITGNQVKKFVWDNIVCRFGLPGEIISDNGNEVR
ncbi:reverse transcriptase domain-containing protein [Tanacetum coccineum]